MKRLAICCLFFLTASFVSVSHADTLLEEDWDGATDEFDIDPGVWLLSQAALDNDAYLVLDAVNGDPEGTGDKALMYRGWQQFEETIESVDTYARNTGGDGLVMEFSVWVEPHLIPEITDLFPPPHHQGAPNQGINGPFHDPNPDPDANPDLNATIGPDTIEFGTNGHWTVHGWAEGSVFNGTPDDPSPTMRRNPHPALRHTGNANINFNTFQSRFGHSEGKFNDPDTTSPHGGSLRVRYTLGATQGGKIEWFNVTKNPSRWVCASTTDATPFGDDACDFRDGNLGPVIEIAPGDPPTTFQQGTSTLPRVRLGWFSRGHMDNPGTPGDEGGRGNCDPIRESPPGTLQPCVPTLDMKTGFPRVGVFIDDITVYTNTLGACNFSGEAGDPSCERLTEVDCLAQGGTFEGDGTVCALILNIPGDCNQDGALDLSDVVHLLGFLFQGRPEDLPCSTDEANLALMDCNEDGGIDLSDAIYKLAFLFQGGPSPVQGSGCILIDDCPPHPDCP